MGQGPAKESIEVVRRKKRNSVWRERKRKEVAPKKRKQIRLCVPAIGLKKGRKETNCPL